MRDEHVVRAADRGDPRGRRPRRRRLCGFTRAPTTTSSSAPRARRARRALGRRPGARRVHLVDLDGARSGRVRPELVAAVAARVAPAPLQASGGIRSLADARALLDAGADRVVVGTAAWPDPTPWLELGDALVLALDVRDGQRARAPAGPRTPGLSFAEALERARGARVLVPRSTATGRSPAPTSSSSARGGRRPARARRGRRPLTGRRRRARGRRRRSSDRRPRAPGVRALTRRRRTCSGDGPGTLSGLGRRSATRPRRRGAGRRVPTRSGTDVERADPERAHDRHPVGRRAQEAVPRVELRAEQVRPDRLGAGQHAEQLHQQRPHQRPDDRRGAVAGDRSRASARTRRSPAIGHA